jgi:hypothetical protein
MVTSAYKEFLNERSYRSKCGPTEEKCPCCKERLYSTSWVNERFCLEGCHRMWKKDGSALVFSGLGNIVKRKQCSEKYYFAFYSAYQGELKCVVARQRVWNDKGCLGDEEYDQASYCNAVQWLNLWGEEETFPVKPPTRQRIGEIRDAFVLFGHEENDELLECMGEDPS